MTESAIIISWGATVPGREHMVNDIFEKSLALYGKLQTDGEIEVFRFYLNQDGPLSSQSGTFIVEGTADQLDAVARKDEYWRLLTHLRMAVANVGSQRAETGACVGQRMKLLHGLHTELGLL